jgi:PHO85 cyclin-1
LLPTFLPPLYHTFVPPATEMANRLMSPETALIKFIASSFSDEMMSFLAEEASEAVGCKITAPHAPSTHHSGSVQDIQLPPVKVFLTSVVQQSQVPALTLMSASVYIARLKAQRLVADEGIHDATHRTLLATIILSDKYLNDFSLPTKYWPLYTSVGGYPGFGYSVAEVSKMERDLLRLLDWKARIDPDDLHFHSKPFVDTIMQQPSQLLPLRQCRCRRRRQLANRHRCALRPLRSQASAS